MGGEVFPRRGAFRPKLEYITPHPAPGRNHGGNCFSGTLAGAGVHGGHVYGSGDKDGAYPHSNPVGPADMTATIFHMLGFRRTPR